MRKTIKQDFEENRTSWKWFDRIYQQKHSIVSPKVVSADRSINQIGLSREMGRNTELLKDFFFEGKKGKAIIFATPEGNFLSPKAVENLLNARDAELIAWAKKKIDEEYKRFMSGKVRPDLNKCRVEGCGHYELGIDDFANSMKSILLSFLKSRK